MRWEEGDYCISFLNDEWQTNFNDYLCSFFSTFGFLCFVFFLRWALVVCYYFCLVFYCYGRGNLFVSSCRLLISWTAIRGNHCYRSFWISDELEGHGNCKPHITTFQAVTNHYVHPRSQVVQRGNQTSSNNFPLFVFVQQPTHLEWFVHCSGIALPSLKLGPATPVELRY